MHALRQVLILGICVASSAGNSIGRRSLQREFTAAVYEHEAVRAVAGSDDPHDVINANLDIYSDVIEAAYDQNADVIGFPEYGLTGLGQSRQWLRQTAEYVPDPRTTASNPCHEYDIEQQPHVKDVVFQKRLSCLADIYSMFIVANVPTYEKCESGKDVGCRSDGIFLYNTNVVYGPGGELEARYRKWTLYYEVNIDQPATVDFDFFDTPFGRLASFVCFDILFDKPAVDLVEKHEIDTALFPTAWQSKLPLMQGVGFHESWAVLQGVNLLASELHLPRLNFAGSGITAGAQGSVEHYFDLNETSPPKLLVSTIPTAPLKPQQHTIQPLPKLGEGFDIFDSIMRGDMFSFVALMWHGHEVLVTQHDTSCSLIYEFSEMPTDERYALAVFQGLHYSAHNSYLEVCTVVKCGNISDTNSCGDPVYKASGIFKRFSLTGQFSSNYVYPSVIVDGGHPTGRKRGWDFIIDKNNHRATISLDNLDKGLVYAALYGRVYELDSITDGNTAASSSEISAMYNIFLTITCFIALVIKII